MLNSRPGLLAATLMTCLHLTAVPGPALVPSQGNRGMVSTAHPIATKAGLEILRSVRVEQRWISATRGKCA